MFALEKVVVMRIIKYPHVMTLNVPAKHLRSRHEDNVWFDRIAVCT